MRTEDINIVGFMVGIAGFGYAVYTAHKMNKLCEKIGSTIADVSDSVNVDVPEAIINQAVDSAVDREVGYAVHSAADKAVKEIKMDMHSQIKNEVDSIYSDVRSTVTDKVSKEVADIDMKKLSRDISDKAEQEIIDKFDGNLDEILENFNRELNSISKIYNSISTAMQGTKDKETILRIS